MNKMVFGSVAMGYGNLLIAMYGSMPYKEVFGFISITFGIVTVVTIAIAAYNHKGVI